MPKKINKRGFTLAEALVAMLLVAIMAAGIITALMATKRAIIAPSNREEMIMAVERASTLLQHGTLPQACGTADADKLTLTPDCTLGTGDNCHNINCLRPRSCQNAGDFFVYSVNSVNNGGEQGDIMITFKIQCAGQTI